MHFCEQLHRAGITEPAQIQLVATLMLDAIYDSAIRKQAESIAEMNKDQLTLAVQQIVGGF